QSTEWLRAQFPKIKILALTMVEDENAVFKMIKAGASGYILKESSPIELLDAIRTIHEKGFYTNEFVSGKLFRSVLNQDDTPKLSERELEFIKLCCSELTYKEIADKMFVSTRTVDNYRESLFLKLSLKSRSGLILYSIKNGIYKF
ncbi:MAG: LuxR C-terminal-related transcriptional regulator, partial [Mucilaginibacter sp.]